MHAIRRFLLLQCRIHADLRAVVEMPSIRAAIQRAGVEPRLMTQPEFAAYPRAEHDSWAPVIRERHIQLD